MLFLHRVLIYSSHLFAGSAPVICSSFCYCFCRYTTQQQTTLTYNSFVTTIVNYWGFIVWILVFPDRFPSFTQLRVDIHFVLFAPHCNSDPSMHKPIRWGRCS